jgi:hypothetical protein
MHDLRPGIAIVSRPTRMDNLLGRWATRGQAKFALKQAKVMMLAQRGRLDAAANAQEEEDADFLLMEDEDEVYRDALKRLRQDLDFGLAIHNVEREYLPTFDFSRCAVVVVVGQDGLVANTAKYVGDLPIVGVNPDPDRIDGVLLPFHVSTARAAVAQALRGLQQAKQVTLALAQLQDGQRLLAFNDFFIGASTHISARYILRAGKSAESQSSSGILVSTGAGSTGWMSSLFNMVAGVSPMLGATPSSERPVPFPWDASQLIWAVREPFVSRTSQANLVSGLLPSGNELVIESNMAAGGVIFSDGVEADFLPFNSGTIARISIAPQRAQLVVR